ncbi:MAG TPA: carbon-nitrogen hydrolase [Candidatus Binataceae bacterium]|nr:carbon-nitrogen hydrolase [Candidatus Binataceae bacterium]HVB81734.1 carbon-nitrogen hydrolase [Candidatus Binataceae bacterium]
MDVNGNRISIGLVQMSCGPSLDDNLARAVAAIEDAAARGATIVCLPELFRSRYFCQTEDPHSFDLAEPVPGPTTERLAAIARKARVVVVGSIFERRAEGVYHNTAVILDADGRLAGRYRKMHIPDDPRYYEKFYFTPGDLDFTAHPTARGRIGALICWDQWFPEAARLVALAGARMIFYPTAIGWDLQEIESVRRRQYDAWETVQRGHAIANGIFVAAVNRVGVEDGLDFWGGSFVADPFGAVIARASHNAEETMVVECDLAEIETTRRNWPFLRDRRIDAYQDLTRRFRL